MTVAANQVAFYGAAGSDYASAVSAAEANGVPLANVTGDFNTAATWVENGDYLVIAVGHPANLALFWNPCGWNTSAYSMTSYPACQTPFDYYSIPYDGGIVAGLFESADGVTARDSLQLAMMLGHYAIYGEYPQYLSTLPTDRMLSGQTCSTSDCTGSSSNTCPTTSTCNFPSTPPSVCDSNQVAFINDYLSYAETASRQTGLPVSFILGHWGIETEWGAAGGLCGTCNNPGNLGTSGCSCAPVAAYSTITDGVNAYISAMNNTYPYVKWAYDHYGLKEACMAIGAGCEPGSGYNSVIYATGRYNGVNCSGTAISNNCYMSSTIAGNGEAYSVCGNEGVTTPSCFNVDGCNGCGYVGCSLYETVTTSCLSPYNCVY